MNEIELTPAGAQIERAIAQGYQVAAWNLYFDAIRDDVPLAVGDEHEVAEWHRRILREIGFPEHRDHVDDHEPSIEERAVRNERGEVIGTKLVANPHAPDCHCDLCTGD
jgi:hypothetical protein